MLAVPDFVFRLLTEAPIPGCFNGRSATMHINVLGRQCHTQLIRRICLTGGYHRLLFYTKGYMASALNSWSVHSGTVVAASMKMRWPLRTRWARAATAIAPMGRLPNKSLRELEQ